MELAVLDDVSIRLGRRIEEGSEAQQVRAWIGDVQAMILARIPDIEERVATGLVSPAVVSAVIANAVIRKVKNPDGKQNERIDDYSYGLTADAARGELFLTDEEWALLLPNTVTGAFSIRPHGLGHTRRGTWVTPTDWVPAP